MRRQLPRPTKQAFETVKELFLREYGREAPSVQEGTAIIHGDRPLPVIFVTSEQGDLLATYAAMGDFVERLELIGADDVH